ncbi:hypothetical protein SAMN06265379_10835 [Saccharicrinis carchari]|uniref:Lipocalin-like domain-containing protein n=1 Tax=Saccharicrinis carchari TaxID=1168039 RepID=A0A521EB16_SACCC|nr:hypothetical protein [Saccharicrinis carchari]SMO80350.1 hypothetical protein SAMN06265379_10835 [Saccharicrinis carchari]
MKKSIFKFTILLSAIAIMTASCGKDDDKKPAQLDGKYKIAMNGKTVVEGKTEEVGMMGNAISLSLGEEFGLLISGVPESVGGEAQIGGNNSETTVVISGKNLLKTGSDEMYFSIKGMVKRSSANKITFEGTCSEMGSSTVHTFSGTAESAAFKTI